MMKNRPDEIVRNYLGTVRQLETAARQSETAVRQSETAVRQSETAARQSETAVRQSETAVRQSETGPALEAIEQPAYGGCVSYARGIPVEGLRTCERAASDSGDAGGANAVRRGASSLMIYSLIN